MLKKLYKANPQAAQQAAQEAAQAASSEEGSSDGEGNVYDADYKVEDDKKDEE